jgi:hypothetical protein
MQNVFSLLVYKAPHSTTAQFAEANPVFWREIQEVLLQGDYFLQECNKVESFVAVHSLVCCIASPRVFVHLDVHVFGLQESRVALTLPPNADSAALLKQACKVRARLSCEAVEFEWSD